MACLRQTSHDFINAYAIEGNAIIWLDYAAAKKTREQFAEFQTLLPKLREYDIVKLTLNANLETLRGSRSTDENQKLETAEVRRQKRFEELEKRIGDFIPHEFDAQSMTADIYPQVLLRSLENAANEALKGRMDILFQPLTAFTYNDLAHQMLTMSGILLKKIERTRFLRACDLRTFKLGSLKWGSYRKIMLPALTAKERLFIDRHLPKWGERAIQKRLNFLFDPNEARSLEILRNYIEFYRQYPNFQRVLF